MRIDLKGFLDGLDIPSGHSRRTDCPICMGTNTFSVSNSSGKLLYNCYKAGCGVHGFVSGQVTLDDCKRSLSKERPRKETYVLPKHFIPRSLETSGVQTYTDIRENRQVFPVVNKDGLLVDAIGKSLVKGVKPKWKRYGSSQHPFVVGPYEGIGVVVEDVLSACAVRSAGYTGIGLLGTVLHGGYGVWAGLFSGLIVALDYDASNKGAELAQKLNWLVPTTYVILEKDLKAYSKEYIIAKLEPARRSLQ